MSQNIRMHNFLINRPKWFLGNWPPVLLSVDHQYFCLSNVLYHSKTFKLKKDLHTESWDIRVWDELGKNCRVFLNCVHSCHKIFILIEYSWYLKVTLTLISVDSQYVQNVVFSFEIGSNGQNHSSSDSYLPTAPPPLLNAG